METTALRVSQGWFPVPQLSWVLGKLLGRPPQTALACAQGSSSRALFCMVWCLAPFLSQPICLLEARLGSWWTLPISVTQECEANVRSSTPGVPTHPRRRPQASWRLWVELQRSRPQDHGSKKGGPGLSCVLEHYLSSWGLLLPTPSCVCFWGQCPFHPTVQAAPWWANSKNDKVVLCPLLEGLNGLALTVPHP